VPEDEEGDADDPGQNSSLGAEGKKSPEKEAGHRCWQKPVPQSHRTGRVPPKKGESQERASAAVSSTAIEGGPESGDRKEKRTSGKEAS